MLKVFKQRERRGVRLLALVALLSSLAVGGMPPPASASSGSYGQLISMNSLPGQQMCLSADGAMGDTVYQLPCRNFSWQLWRMKDVGNGYWNIISALNQQCLDVYAFNHDNGGKVTTWPCNGFTNQQWSIGQSRAGFTLKPRHSQADNYWQGKCLDVFAYHHDYGWRVVQWDCLGGVNQLWSFDLWR